ncbi:RNA methyltransferase, TrmH family [Pseudarcicella hirudinis]|uniref:RNA methyltransferase, TrmH family n=1 Tax=Pseudarcicella hirudinis TaxID=1079859 RepID=A0A1I5Y8Q6_9BACT|nr:RNA methyltransferase [Pseudarcicella hirudinis]SFQ40621.1 RNA methyltransferase, TrmH family [Pseudarcicella hirudinis]
MLSKNQIKYINSLQLKKTRQENQAFIVEGAKSVLELLNSDFEVQNLYVSEDFYKENNLLWDKQPFAPEIVNQNDLEKVGSFSSNNAAVAVVKTKENRELLAEEGEFVLILDDIRDPGNLGTIIRIADWYGISKIVCTNSTVDMYNPKVISATMGSFSRVSMFYTDLTDFLGKLKDINIYGAFLGGENIHRISFPASGYIIMGNESNGISEEVGRFVTHRITIPRFGVAESLNAGIATAVICDNLRRNTAR